MIRLARFLFFAVFVRGVILVALGLAVRRRERLPLKGPAVLAANHNSHLDALALMSLMPLALLPKLRPVAAVDYFFATRARGWFATHIIGIIPLKRGRLAKGVHPLEACMEALDRGEILVLFPEGSRGEPEKLGQLKTGIGHLACARPQVPVVPVYMHGLGKALPRGSSVLVPFNCTVSVGEAHYGSGTHKDFMAVFETRMAALAAEETVPDWD